MLKKIIAASVGLVLSGSFALGLDVNGVYSGSNNGQNVVVTLNSQDGVVRGQVAVNGNLLPLVGREVNGGIQGVWRGPAGQEIPFVAAPGADGLSLQTNGVTYALTKGDTTRASSAMNQPNGGQMAPAAAPADSFVANNTPSLPAAEVQLETRQGRVMQCDIPAGWSFTDSSNGVDSMAPDGITWMSKTFLHGIGRTTPDMLLQRVSRSWANLGIVNAQVVSTKEIAANCKLYELDYTFRNRPAHAVVQVEINLGPGGYMASIVTLQSAREEFAQRLPMMIAMAKSVRVTNASNFCDGGKMDQLAKERYAIAAKSAQDVGNIIISGEAARGHIRDESFKGADDTLRDVNRFKDAQGNEYTTPLQGTRAFKHADGTITYTGSSWTPVPAGATELNPYDYSGR